MENTSSYFIPKDKTIPVEIGTNMLFLLQKVMIFMLADKTKEELDELTQAAADKNVPEDSWMAHYVTIHTLVQGIEEAAMIKGIAQGKPIES